jgi:hypothetical protein
MLNSQEDIFPRILDAAYPTCDFLLISITACLIWIGRSKPVTSYLEMLIGFVVFIGADILLGHFNSPDSLIYQILDLFYFLGYFFLALAARSQLAVIREQSASLIHE